MTTLHEEGNALFYVAIITSDGAVADDKLTRFTLADMAQAFNSNERQERNQFFFATAEERDDFIEEYNQRVQEATLVGYVRRSNCGTSIKISISTERFADCRTYETSTGERYTPLLIKMEHLDRILSGQRAVTTIVQQGVAE